MRSSIVYSALLASIASAVPVEKRESDFSPDNVYFPLKADNFPNPDQAAITKIQKDAHGTLPNGPPPKTISAEAKTSLKLIALNELAEVAFFSELVYNVTNKLPGYDLGAGQEYVLDALAAIVAQEELHALNANGALKAFGEAPIEPCKYNFPVTDFQGAISLAAAFTDMVLGTLQEVNQIMAQNGDFGLVRAVSSVLGNEAEQEGFFRLINRKRPSAKPFLTTSAREFAFSAIQGLAVNGSCPNINTIPLKAFKPLVVESTKIEPKNQQLRFSFAAADIGSSKPDQLKVVFINGQNTPIVQPLTAIDSSTKQGRVSFEAQFDYEQNVLDGFTIAAVTQGAANFTSVDDVVKATVLGPGIIEIDSSIMGKFPEIKT